MSAAALASGVDFERDVTGDRYLGAADALIRAGIITAEQLPQGTSVTFFDGVKVDGRTVKGAQFERWMQVRVWGKEGRQTRFVVTKGVARHERERRERVKALLLEELERNAPKSDIGPQGVRDAFRNASATLKVGTHVLAGGHAAVVTGEYQLHRVRDSDGEFSSSNGGRIDYRWGYVCRLTDGDEFFFAAHDLALEPGCPSHLRIVHSAPKSRPLAEHHAEEGASGSWPFPCVHGDVPN